jgi:hypothetical protein
MSLRQWISSGNNNCGITSSFGISGKYIQSEISVCGQVVNEEDGRFK